MPRHLLRETAAENRRRWQAVHEAEIEEIRQTPLATVTLLGLDPIPRGGAHMAQFAMCASGVSILHLSPLSKGDAALFAAGGLNLFVPHPLKCPLPSGTKNIGLRRRVAMLQRGFQVRQAFQPDSLWPSTTRRRLNRVILPSSASCL
jgi:hypothetical protein